MEGARIDGVLTGTSSEGQVECGLSVRPQICRRRASDLDRVADVLASGIESLDGARNELLTVYSWERLPALERHGFRVREYSGTTGVILLDLTVGPDAVFKQFSETRRNKIRRAMRANVTVSEMSIETDFDAYYAILKDWCAFKGNPVPPYETQRTTFAAKNRLVLVAKAEGRIVGTSIFRFQRGGLMEYAANVSRREETKVRQNDLLLWRGIEWGCAQGFRTFSMGGAHFFLQKFGGRIVPTYRYRLDRSLFRRHDAGEGLRNVLAGLFRKLPVPVQERIRRAKSDGAESPGAEQ